ncbi:MAG: hypothetical protein HC922_07915 [Leptolyngbyaceae cyanobacterium SM2_3_12]|nr:hypothetical protein [Leptolyngbyaceae cyanobacterium SM2_3_12]
MTPPLPNPLPPDRLDNRSTTSDTGSLEGSELPSDRNGATAKVNPPSPLVLSSSIEGDDEAPVYAETTLGDPTNTSASAVTVVAGGGYFYWAVPG